MILYPGTMLQDRYEILEKIGSGGMSDVYKAKCHKLNRLVAIKVLKSEFTSDATFVSKFKMEAQAAAGLSHPNIVNIYDVVVKSPPTLIPTNCSVLRTPTILPNIRISWDYHPTFMLISGRVPRSFTHL